MGHLVADLRIAATPLTTENMSDCPHAVYLLLRACIYLKVTHQHYTISSVLIIVTESSMIYITVFM